MITLYGFGRVHPAVIGETRDLRVQWALEECGLPYRVQGLDHTGGELDGEEYSRLNCFHQLPAIDDDGFVISESAAILLYLAEKSGKLIPSDFQGRTRVVQWSFAALATVEPPLQEILLIDGGGFKNTGDHRNTNLLRWADRVLGGVERRLEGRTWLATDEFTVADMLLSMVLREQRKIDLIKSHPNLKAYYARAFDRPAWRKALAAYAERLGAKVADLQS